MNEWNVKCYFRTMLSFSLHSRQTYVKNLKTSKLQLMSWIVFLLIVGKFCCFESLSDFLQSHYRNFTNQIVDEEVTKEVASFSQAKPQNTSNYVPIPEMNSEKSAISSQIDFCFWQRFFIFRCFQSWINMLHEIDTTFSHLSLNRF